MSWGLLEVASSGFELRSVNEVPMEIVGDWEENRAYIISNGMLLRLSKNLFYRDPGIPTKSTEPQIVPLVESLNSEGTDME